MRLPSMCPIKSPGPDHSGKNPGEDRPDHANKPEELYEKDAPDLP